MSLATQVAALEAENAALKERLAILQQRLNLDEPEVAGLDLMIRYRLPRQQAETLRVLLAAKGRPVSRYGIEAAVTLRDHRAEPSRNFVSVLIHNLRKTLGPDAIETIEGIGWRISPNFRVAA
jgi:DNA-binding response OmpR family regulator